MRKDEYKCAEMENERLPRERHGERNRERKKTPLKSLFPGRDVPAVGLQKVRGHRSSEEEKKVSSNLQKVHRKLVPYRSMKRRDDKGENERA